MAIEALTGAIPESIYPLVSLLLPLTTGALAHVIIRTRVDGKKLVDEYHGNGHWIVERIEEGDVLCHAPNGDYVHTDKKTDKTTQYHGFRVPSRLIQR